MSVVTPQACWRWAVVAAAVVVLAALPPAVAALPAGGSAISAQALRARIMLLDRGCRERPPRTLPVGVAPLA